jgi:hypothetical protein
VKPTNLSFLRFSQNQSVYVENLFSKVKHVANTKNKQGVHYLEVSGLEEGLYVLRLKKEDVTVYVQVHKGEIWNHTQDFLIKERSIIERTRQRVDGLRINEVSVRSGPAEDNVEERPSCKDAQKVVQRVQVLLGGDYN